MSQLLYAYDRGRLVEGLAQKIVFPESSALARHDPYTSVHGRGNKPALSLDANKTCMSGGLNGPLKDR